MKTPGGTPGRAAEERTPKGYTPEGQEGADPSRMVSSSRSSRGDRDRREEQGRVSARSSAPGPSTGTAQPPSQVQASSGTQPIDDTVSQTDQAAAEAAQRDIAFLAEASAILASSLDYQTTLSRLTGLVVPYMADWCAVDLLNDDGALRRAAVAHVDPAKAELARELLERYPLELGRPNGVPKVLRTGRPVLYSVVPDSALQAVARDPEHLRILRSLGFKSEMIVPLAARDRTFGTMLFVRSSSARPYTQADLVLAHEVSRRAGLAVDNARLYRAEQEGRQRLSHVLESISDAFFALDRAWRFTYINDRAAQVLRRLLRKEPEDLLGTNIWGHFPEVVGSPLYRAQHRAVEERAAGVHEEFSPRFDAWFEYRFYPSDEGLSVYFRDVTARKQVQQSLALYREIIARSTEAIALLDLQGRCLEQNAAHHDLLGYSDEDLVGKTPAIHMGEETFAGIVRELAATGRYAGEVACRRKDGTPLEIELSAFAVNDETGKPRCYVGIKRDITSRKRVERALRESEERYRRLVELCPEAILVHQGGRVVYANPAGLRLFGATRPDALLGRPVLDLVHPDFHEAVKTRLQQVQEGRPVELMEEKNVRLDGQPIYVEAVATPIIYNGAPAQQAIIRDITGRRRAEEALREGLAFKDQLVGLLPAAVYSCDAEGRITSYNRRAVELWGREPRIGDPEKLFTTASGLRHPDGRLVAYDQTPMAKALRTGIPVWDRELVIVRPEGSERTVLVNIAPIWNPTGALAGTVNCFIDITERKQALDALNLYREIVANASDAIAVIDEGGWYVDHNEAFRRLVGYSLEELPDCTPAVHLGAEAFAVIQRELAMTDSYRGELRTRHKNGKETEVDIVSFAIPRQTGGPNRYVMITRDISERKRTQGLLLDQARELAVLAERNRLAGEIHDTLAQDFVGINFQLGAVQTHWRDAPPEVTHSIQRSMGLANHGIRQSQAMVWDLVPLELEGQPLEVALGREIERSSALGGWKASLKVSGRRRKVEHRAEVAILRICQEALANVNQHAHAKAVAVHLAFNQRTLSLTIEDDGVGFDIHRTGSHGARRQVGLANMETRARQLRGRLAVRSTPGKGTTVRCIFPWSAVAAPEPGD